MENFETNEIWEKIIESAKKSDLKTRIASKVFIRSENNFRDSMKIADYELQRYQNTGDISKEFKPVLEEWTKDGRP